MRRDPTDAEAKLWRRLQDGRLGGLKFRRQVPIGDAITDFVCYQHRLVIEVDGGQHADSRRDKLRDAELGRRGFRVLRFWNNDVLGNIESVMAEIARAVGLHVDR